MAEITAALVKQLRVETGTGMMDCKKALIETDGDMEAAVDWLRTKGLASAAQKAGRVASDGLVGVATGNHGASAVASTAAPDVTAPGRAQHERSLGGHRDRWRARGGG